MPNPIRQNVQNVTPGSSKAGSPAGLSITSRPKQIVSLQTQTGGGGIKRPAESQTHDKTKKAKLSGVTITPKLVKSPADPNSSGSSKQTTGIKQGPLSSKPGPLSTKTAAQRQQQQQPHSQGVSPQQRQQLTPQQRALQQGQKASPGASPLSLTTSMAQKTVSKPGVPVNRPGMSKHSPAQGMPQGGARFPASSAMAKGHKI